MRSDSLTRRQLLRGATYAGLTLAGIPPVRAVGALDRLQVALIGVGERGMTHLNTLLERPDVRIVAIADVDERHRQTAKLRVDQQYGDQSAKIYGDFRELLAAGGVDVAVIAVPNHWHALIGIACLEAGLDVYGETPLAHSVVEGRALCHAVARNGRVWQTGNHLRSHPLFQRACSLVASGRLGVTRTVEIGTYGGYMDLTGDSKRGFFLDALGLDYEMWLGPAAWVPYHPGRVHQNWRWHRSFGGGHLLSWISLYGDIALWSLGLESGGPRQIQASGTFADHPLYNVPTNYTVEATFANDMVLRASSSLAPGIRWHGDDGWLYVSPTQLRASSPSLLQTDGVDDWAVARFSAHGRDHWEDFFAAVRTRRSPISTCESAQRASSIGHLGMLSLLGGREVSWIPEKEQVKEDPNLAEWLEPAYRYPWMLTD